jgi:hypothetical protein
MHIDAPCPDTRILRGKQGWSTMHAGEQCAPSAGHSPLFYWNLLAGANWNFVDERPARQRLDRYRRSSALTGPPNLLVSPLHSLVDLTLTRRSEII